MSNESRASIISNIILTICAVILTGFAVGLNLFPDRMHPRPVTSTETLSDWDSLVSTGHQMGPDSAKVHILEFADMECPVCGYFSNNSLRGALLNHFGQIRVTFRHWPLSYHRFAYPAARAAECAAEQDRFWEFQSEVFAKQDSLGLKTFMSFAQESGIPDTAAFLTCNATTGPIPAIDEDRRTAESHHFTGTPTVIINGKRYGNPPDSLALDALINEILKGQN